MSIMSINQSDLFLAHKYRLSLKYAPRQSNFRVVALIFLEKDSVLSNTDSPPLVCWHGDRPYLLGTNAEACWIGNSICAERSALTMLRWYPSAVVNKIVIATDAPGAIAPGMLCREFMASCDQIPWDTPIVLGGTNCQRCKLEHGGGDDERCPDGTGHDTVACVVPLQSLYPHPSLYVRTKPIDCVAFGKEWEASLAESENKLLKIARSIFDSADADGDDNHTELHPITYAAAVLFRDKSYATSRCVKLLEYGCSMDAVTQLAPILKAKRKRGLEATQIVQVDQFGIAHPPFAPARAFLAEQGYGHVSVLMHTFDLEGKCLLWNTAKASALAPMAPEFVKQLSGDMELPAKREHKSLRLNNIALPD